MWNRIALPILAISLLIIAVGSIYKFQEINLNTISMQRIMQFY